MRIARAELFELTLPLVEPFVISGGTIAERRSLIVALHDDAGNVGYGESPPFQLPSAYPSGGDVFPEDVKRAFEESYALAARGEWFEVWRCRQP